MNNEQALAVVSEVNERLERVIAQNTELALELKQRTIRLNEANSTLTLMTHVILRLMRVTNCPEFTVSRQVIKETMSEPYCLQVRDEGLGAEVNYIFSRGLKTDADKTCDQHDFRPPRADDGGKTCI